MDCEIVAVGTELLLGDTLNSNAQYLSKKLSALGINVFFQTTVGDNEKRIKSVLEAAFKRAEIVITTGGLGPTSDDITKEACAEYFEIPLKPHDESLKRIKEYFARMNTVMPENNVKQAMLPEGCMVLENNVGTAPGCIMEKDGKILITLPGPPSEMKPMFEAEVFPYLKEKSECVFVSRTLKLCGIGESAAASEVSDILDSQKNPTVAPYVHQNGVTFRITAKAKNEEEAGLLIDPVAEKIYERLGSFIYGEDDESLAESLLNALRRKKMKLAVAESCTGGLVSAAVTDVPGASEVFIQAAVTYSNEAKISRLNVSAETVEKYGAVSEECALEMAKGIAETSGAEVGISVTGIAGPGGGTTQKPVGLVYVGLYVNGKGYSKKYNISGDRDRVRKRAATNALAFARGFIA